ncbi:MULTISPECIES: ABC transporter permease [Bacillus]|uniref:ABC transporter permease n=2 Tax=Bacillus cereus group TaxID=86661 RepID=A0A2A7D6H3_BACAN|nr:MULTISPECIES: ABC transporter permease [Bacillus]OTW72297.1 ABC transporter permease [Bacillus thuringiensis serovar coreanensis]OTX49354.1 ABC transporter permease [Bacillus thuringiensis serovar sooncheon]OTX57469.1 ABC transporter permease [Bacillus thuringiensis serovar guiyangiensis]OTX71687.1 ABC transporter permease [Bacillus thuringiensis serovar roskildiensis]PDZ15616.1 ABC transporter permease [Bacillus anthracis]
MIKQQFYKRLRHELGRKWKSIRSITDWTVALYIIIPALIFIGIYYRSLWIEELSMGETVYFGLGLFAFYVITYSRGVRSFFEQADSLFLISYPAHMQKLIQYGMTYTFIRIAITNVVVVAAMLPVLMKSIGVTKIQVVLFWVFFTVFRFLLSLLTRFIHIRVGKRWLLWIMKNVMFSISLTFFGLSLFLIYKNPFYSILCIGLAVFLIIVLIKEKLNYKNCFFKEVETEKEESMRWTSGIMQVGGHTAKPSSSNKKPWMFPRSKKFLGKKKESRIVESFLKEFFRTSSARIFYIQLLCISTVSIIMSPRWIAAIILAFTLVGISRYARDYWNEFSKKMFLHLYCDEGKLLLLRWKADRYLLFPVLLLYGIVILSHFYLLLAVIAGILFIVWIGWIVFLP